MHHIAFGGHQVALLLPFIVHNVVASDAQLQRFLREPEEWQHHIWLYLIVRRKYQHQRGQIGCAGQVKPSIANTSLPFIGIDDTTAIAPLVHGHPANRLLHPLIEAQLPEHVFVRRCFQGFTVSVAHLVDGNRVIQGRIGAIPVLLIRPVRLIRQAEQHGIKTRIIFAAFEDIEGLLVYLPADAVAVGARCCKEEPQRLLSGVAGALRHDIVQRACWLGVQLIKDAGGHVQAVLGCNLTGQHLIDGAGRLVDHALHRWDDLDALHERRGLLHHVHSNVEHDGRLLPVRRTGINLRLPLIIVDQHVQRDGRAQLALAILLRDFDVRRSVLPLGGVILAHGAKHIPDDLLLPGQQLEGLSMKLTLGVLQCFNKTDDALSFSLIKGHVTTLPSAAVPWDHLTRHSLCRHRLQ